MPLNSSSTKGKYTLSRMMMMVVCVIVAVITLVVVLIFAMVYNRSLYNSAMVSSEQTIAQVETTVDNYLSDMKDSLDIICSELADIESVQEGDNIISVAAQMQSDVAAVMVYDLEGRLLAYGVPSQDSKAVLKHDLSRNLSFNKELFSSAPKYAVTSPHVQNLFKQSYPWVVTIARRETLPVYGGAVYVAMDFRFSSIASYVDNVGIGQHGYSYIIGTDGGVVYHPQQQMIFAGIKDEDTSRVTGLKDGVYNRDEVIYTLNTLPGSSWRIVGVSYVDDLISSGTRTTTTVFLLVALLCFVVAILISLLFSQVVTKPVRSLAEAMHQFEEDPEDFSYAPQERSVYELQTLSDSFQQMVRIIQVLMEQVRSEEVTLRKTELKALQAQINPHFLYNTLDSIQWMCEQDKSDEAVEMVGALAKLFRISISRGNELIPVSEELKHAQSYLIIQSHRYKNQFDYAFQIDGDVLSCMCNKITIQPLIENAIYHGLDRMVDKGHILITALSDGEDVVMTVEDNGVGMTDEQCRGILQKDRTDSSGIGIKNVNDRLKIYFGDKYGVSIESELDVGTKVTVRFPKTQRRPENEA